MHEHLFYYFCAQVELANSLETAEKDKAQMQKEVTDLRLQVATLEAKLRETKLANTGLALTLRPARVDGPVGNQTVTQAISNVASDTSQQTSGEGNSPIAYHDSLKPLTVSLSTNPSPKTSWSEDNLELQIAADKDSNLKETIKVADKMGYSEVSTDSSGDTWPDPHSLPEISGILASGATKELKSTLGKPILRGNDEIDGREVSNSPFSFTEIPVTITMVNSAMCSNGDEEGDRDHAVSFVETDSEDSHSDEEVACNQPNKVSHSEPSMTRDKTMKIFKQLKKAKQRAKKSLAPSPKITKSLPDIPKELRERKNSFESVTPGKIPEGFPEDGTTDVDDIKDDILAKSGKFVINLCRQ